MADDLNRPLAPGELFSHTPHPGLGPRPVDVAASRWTGRRYRRGRRTSPVEPGPLPDRDVPLGEAYSAFRK